MKRLRLSSIGLFTVILAVPTIGDSRRSARISADRPASRGFLPLGA